MTDRLVSYLRAHLVDAGQDYFPYQLMSDEEMTAIDSGAESPFIVRPWIEAQEDIDADVATRFGQRSLLIRGLLEVQADDDAAEPSITISDDLRFLADSRRLGVGYILARSSGSDGQRACNHALQSEIGTFEEQIDTEGYHLFTACTYPTAVRRLADWALPGIEHNGAEMHTRVAAERWAPWIVNELGVGAATAEINLFLPGTPDRSEPETWRLAHAHGAAVLGLRDGEHMEVISMTVDGLEARLAARLSDALAIPMTTRRRPPEV